MLIADAQRDLRRAYVGGGPGILISATAWLVAAWVQYANGVQAGFVALFIGGIFIFPISKLICRFVFRRKNESSSNPFGMTVLECTIAMIAGLFAAWLFLETRPALVFPLAAIAVGAHYFVFSTAYGDRVFWILGTLITAIGLMNIFVPGLRGSTPLLVALVELAFGLIVTFRATGSRQQAERSIS